MPLSPGQVLNNRYRIVKLLGQGGFGAVYKAWDIVSDLLRDGDDKAVAFTVTAAVG